MHYTGIYTQALSNFYLFRATTVGRWKATFPFQWLNHSAIHNISHKEKKKFNYRVKNDYLHQKSLTNSITEPHHPFSFFPMSPPAEEQR